MEECAAGVPDLRRPKPTPVGEGRSRAVARPPEASGGRAKALWRVGDMAKADMLPAFAAKAASAE
jgi:hypothetical protein